MPDTTDETEVGDLRRELAEVKERSDRVRDELNAIKAEPFKFLAGLGYTLGPSSILIQEQRPAPAGAGAGLQLRTLAIEFSVSDGTAQLHAPDTATSNERAMTNPVRCRVLVPADIASGQAVLSFYEEKNELGEVGWSPIINAAPIVGGLALHQRVVVALALQALAAHLTGVANFKTMSLANGSLIINLGTV